MTRTLWPGAVRAAVVRRLAHDGGETGALAAELDEGAEITSLDVVLVALDVEDLVALDVEDIDHQAVPFEDLARIRTVGQLLEALCVQRACDAYETDTLAAEADSEASDLRDDVDHVARRTLATYLGVDVDAVEPASHLRDELHMATVDIALVMLRLEDMARVQFPQPAAQLVGTVHDLTEVYRALLRAKLGPPLEVSADDQLSVRRGPWQRGQIP